MKKRVVKKSQVLKEGYIKGLQAAIDVIEEALNIDDLMKKVDDHDNRASSKAASDQRDREMQIWDFLEFVDENQDTFASLIKLGKRLLKSASLRHLVTEWPDATFTNKKGFRADGFNHRLGFYIPNNNDYENIMIGACGGGACGPIDLAVDEKGYVYVFNERNSRMIGTLYSQQEDYVNNERLFSHLSKRMQTIRKVDDFVQKLEAALN